MISFVCFLWNKERRPEDRYFFVKKYTTKHVNALYGMIKHHLREDFGFFCVTNEKTGFDKNIGLIDVPEEVSKWTFGQYQKMFFYSKELSSRLSTEFVVCLDLDLVVTGDFGHIINRKNRISLLGSYKAIWKRIYNKYPRVHPHRFLRSRRLLLSSAFLNGRERFLYNTSFVVKEREYGHYLYEAFDYDRAIKEKKRIGVAGTDQLFVSLHLDAKDKPRLIGPKDGVYYAESLMMLSKMPSNTCIITSPGSKNIWDVCRSKSTFSEFLTSNYEQCGIRYQDLIQDKK
jgi:hypothetical protein